MANCLSNAVWALQRRVLTCKGKQQPKPKPFALMNIGRAFKRRMKTFPNLEKQTQQHILELQKNPRKRAYIEKAIEQLSQGYVYKVPCKIKAFTKKEKTEIYEHDLAYDDDLIHYSDNEKGHIKDPRMVMPTEVTHRLQVSQFFGGDNEHIIINNVNETFGYTVVMKGLDTLQVGEALRGSWDFYAGQSPVCCLLDCSRFDAHVNTTTMRWAQSVYADMLDECYQIDAVKLLRDFEKLAISVHCPDGNVKVKTKKSVLPSGVPVTSTMAVLIVCGVLYKYRHWARFFDNGDDFGFIAPASVSTRLSKDLVKAFDDIGQEVIVEGSTTIFEKIKFCQMQPVWNGEQYTMTRGLEALQKDLFKMKRGLRRDVYIKAVSEGGKSLSSGIPVFQKFYDVLGRKLTKVKLSKWALDGGLKYWARFGEGKIRAVEDESRLSFARAYDISPNLQVEWETAFENGFMWKMKGYVSDTYGWR